MDRDPTFPGSPFLAAVWYGDRLAGPVLMVLGVACLFLANRCYSDREGPTLKAEALAHALGFTSLLAGFTMIGLCWAILFLNASGPR